MYKIFDVSLLPPPPDYMEYLKHNKTNEFEKDLTLRNSNKSPMYLFWENAMAQIFARPPETNDDVNHLIKEAKIVIETSELVWQKLTNVAIYCESLGNTWEIPNLRYIGHVFYNPSERQAQGFDTGFFFISIFRDKHTQCETCSNGQFSDRMLDHLEQLAREVHAPMMYTQEAIGIIPRKLKQRGFKNIDGFYYFKKITYGGKKSRGHSRKLFKRLRRHRCCRTRTK